MKPRRSVVGASSGRGRKDSTIDEASAFVALSKHARGSSPSESATST